MLRFEDLRVRDRQVLDRDFFNRRYRLIAETIARLDQQLASVDAATDRLLELGLARVDSVLAPALAQVQAAAERGFLVARSTTPLSLSEGLETTLVIDDDGSRSVFSPTPYVLLTRDAEEASDQWALLRVQEYNRDNGGLAFKVIAMSAGMPAEARDDWVISATAGLARTILETAADVDQAVTLAQEAASEAQQAASLAEQAIADGPVSSVNGQTGMVSLGLSDIPGLLSSLGGKAASNHAHGIADINNLAARLEEITNPDGGSY